MGYVISVLPLQPFHPLFGLDDAALHARGMRRHVADGPGYPCRITLENAAPGETLLLLHWQHPEVETPYRPAGPLFVGEPAVQPAVFRNRDPEQQRSRLLSVRAYEADGWVSDAEVRNRNIGRRAKGGTTG